MIEIFVIIIMPQLLFQRRREKAVTAEEKEKMKLTNLELEKTEYVYYVRNEMFDIEIIIFIF